MANPFYTYSGAFLPGTLARAEAETIEFTAVQTGFALLAIQGTDSGAANAYVVTTAGGKDGVYADGMIVEFKAANGNTGNCTIAVDSGPTVNLTQPSGTSLASGSIVANAWYRCVYNSTYGAFAVVAPTPTMTLTSNTISGASPTYKVGLTAAGGDSTACVPIDAKYAIDETISPTWTGTHTFSGTVDFLSPVNFASVGLTFTAGVNNPAFTVTGSNNTSQTTGSYLVKLFTGTALGFSNGPYIRAGTNAGDVALRVDNAAGTEDYFFIYGDGSGFLGFNGTTYTIGFANSGYTTLNGAFLVNNAAGSQGCFYVTSNGISGYGPVGGGLVDMTPDESNFTVTYTGMASTIQGQAYWTRVGNLVLLVLPIALGTSNADTFTATGIPAAIQPARQQNVAVPQNSFDNATATAASPVAAQVNTNGTISFAIGNSSAGWTSSGTKGVAAAFTIMYLLN